MDFRRKGISLRACIHVDESASSSRFGTISAIAARTRMYIDSGADYLLKLEATVCSLSASRAASRPGYICHPNEGAFSHRAGEISFKRREEL